MYIPESIKSYISDKTYTLDSIGASDSQVLCFEDMVLKIEKESQESENHARMLRWLEGKLPVPRLIAYEKADGISWLLTSKIQGEMVCDESVLRDPYKATVLMARALQMLWEVDISDCPSDCGVEQKLRQAEYNVKNGLCSTEDAEPETYGEGGFKDPAELLCRLWETHPKEDFVLSHGDFCLPNVFAENGRISGFIDLGRCGRADRYQDIALCFRSLKNNYNGTYGYEDKSYDPRLLFELLGIKPDMDKIKYYILLDELF